jgi:hypothetical protein
VTRTLVATFGTAQPKWCLANATVAAGEAGENPVIMSVLSTAYVQVTVQAMAAGLPVNPTADVVALAFTTVGTDPVTGNWHTGSWDTDPATYTYRAQLLVGPTGLVLARGTYQVWVKVTDSPEVPVGQAGTLQVV